MDHVIQQVIVKKSITIVDENDIDQLKLFSSLKREERKSVKYISENQNQANGVGYK